MVKTDGFEPDPWLWPYAPQSTRPRVWALWTTIPAGGSWQGKPKRFLSAPLVNDVLKRGVFPVPKDLKRSPLAPLMDYRHPLYSDRISYAYRFNCNPPSELQDWARRYAPADCLPPARDLREQLPETDTPSTLLPSAGFGRRAPRNGRRATFGFKRRAGGTCSEDAETCRFRRHVFVRCGTQRRPQRAIPFGHRRGDLRMV